MTPAEAQEKIGFTMRSSVMYALKTGQIRARGNGDIIEESVDRFIKKREASAEIRRLFHTPTADLDEHERDLLRAHGQRRRT